MDVQCMVFGKGTQLLQSQWSTSTEVHGSKNEVFLTCSSWSPGIVVSHHAPGILDVVSLTKVSLEHISEKFPNSMLS